MSIGKWDERFVPARLRVDSQATAPDGVRSMRFLWAGSVMRLHQITTIGVKLM
jgi:hypothetical protein